MTRTAGYKTPVSVLVVVHTAAGEVLLLERATPPGFWQSVTGSLEPGETPQQAARRELEEETGLTTEAGEFRDHRHSVRFPILPAWRHRYAPDVRENTEHWFSLRLPRPLPIRLSPAEHRDLHWLGWRAAAAQASSWTNRDAILALGAELDAG